MQPRVVSVCLDLSPTHGGMYRAVTDVARMLESPIVTFRDGSGREPPTVTDVPVTTIDWSHESLLRQAVFPSRAARWAADAAVSAADILVVHSLFRSHTRIVHQFAASRGIPYVVVPHGALEPVLWRSRRLLRHGWLAAGGAAYLRDATAIVFATRSEWAHAEITLRHRLPETVIPFPVAMVEPPVTDDKRATARERLGLPAEQRLLLVLGRLDPVKRPREILAGFAAAATAGCDLVIGGMDGAIMAADLQRILPASIRAQVWFLGGLNAERRDTVLAACDGYLSWSRHESFGYAAAESMAAGLPVILPPGHGLRSEIMASGCGLFPDHDDEPSLVAALREFAGWSVETIRTRGAAGRAWIGQHLSPDLVAQRWRRLCETVLQPGT